MGTDAEHFAGMKDKELLLSLRFHLRDLKRLEPGIVRQWHERMVGLAGQEIGRRAWAKYRERRRKESF